VKRIDDGFDGWGYLVIGGYFVRKWLSEDDGFITCKEWSYYASLLQARWTFPCTFPHAGPGPALEDHFYIEF
jgi:hypothetical protein